MHLRIYRTPYVRGWADCRVQTPTNMPRRWTAGNDLLLKAICREREEHLPFIAIYRLSSVALLASGIALHVVSELALTKTRRYL